MSNLITIALAQPNNNIGFKPTKDFISSIETQSNSFVNNLFGKRNGTISLETLLIKGGVYNLITLDQNLLDNVEYQLKFHFPKITIQKTDDPLLGLDIFTTEFILKENDFNPILTFENFPNHKDPILLNNYNELLTIQGNNDLTLIQIVFDKKDDDWQVKTANNIELKHKMSNGKNYEDKNINILLDKISYPCYDCTLRVISTTNKNRDKISKLFNPLERGGSNSFLAINEQSFLNNSKDNSFERHNNKKIVLNSPEIATIWHL